MIGPPRHASHTWPNVIEVSGKGEMDSQTSRPRLPKQPQQTADVAIGVAANPLTLPVQALGVALVALQTVPLKQSWVGHPPVQIVGELHVGHAEVRQARQDLPQLFIQDAQQPLQRLAFVMQSIEQRRLTQILQQHLLEGNPVEQWHDIAIAADGSFLHCKALVARDELRVLDDPDGRVIVGWLLDQVLHQVRRRAVADPLGEQFLAQAQSAHRRAQLGLGHARPIRRDEIPHPRELEDHRIRLLAWMVRH